MAWLRLYDDILDDPKVQMLSDRAFRMLVNLWCLAKRHGGKLPESLDTIAFALRWPVGRVRDTLQILISAKLIEHSGGGFVPHNWNGRQYQTDVSTERVKRFRKRHETQNETPPEDRVQKTEAETDSESKKSIGRAAKRAPSILLNGHLKDFEAFYAIFPKHKSRRAAEKAYGTALKRADAAVILEGAQHYARNRKGEDVKFTLNPATWLNGDGWLDEAPITEANQPDPDLERIRKIEAELMK